MDVFTLTNDNKTLYYQENYILIQFRCSVASSAVTLLSTANILKCRSTKKQWVVLLNLVVLILRECQENDSVLEQVIRIDYIMSIRGHEL